MNLPYGVGENRGAAVGEIVAVDGRQHEVVPAEFGITSIANELGRDVSWAEARDVLLPALETEFDLRFERAPATAPLLAASR